MRIQMLSDLKVYQGDPLEIVKNRSEDAIHMRHESLDEYIDAVVRRLQKEGRPKIKITGATIEDRCEALIIELVHSRLAKVFVNKVDLDRHAVRIIRRALGMSQERLAHELGVAFSSVNRWENGKNSPGSGAIIKSVERTAGDFVAA